jgi:two-component system nitrogen regulation response regulator NtrX
MALEVLVVDDEADIRELVSGVLEDEGYGPHGCRQQSDARRGRGAPPVDGAARCLAAGAEAGWLQVLQEIKRRDPTIPG